MGERKQLTQPEDPPVFEKDPRVFEELVQAMQLLAEAFLGIADILTKNPEIIRPDGIENLKKVLQDLENIQIELGGMIVSVSEEYRNNLPLAEGLRNLIKPGLNIDPLKVSAKEWDENKEKVVSLIEENFGGRIADLFYGINEVDSMAFFRLPPQFTLDKAIEVLSQFEEKSGGYALRRASLEPFLRAGLVVYEGIQGGEHGFRQITVGKLGEFMEEVSVGELRVPKLSLHSLGEPGDATWSRTVNALIRNGVTTIGIAQLPNYALKMMYGIGDKSIKEIIPRVREGAEGVVKDLGLSDIEEIPEEVFRKLCS